MSKTWHVKYTEVIEHSIDIDAPTREEAKHLIRRMLQEQVQFKNKRVFGKITAEAPRKIKVRF